MKTALLSWVLISPLAAQFITPEWRGNEASGHVAWDLFTQAKFEPNFPDLSPDPDATLRSSTSSAFLTSSRNIYSFQSPLALQLDDRTSLEVRNLILQVRTLGVGLDAGGAVLLFESEGSETVSMGPTRFFVISEEELTGERGGTGTTYALQWDLRETPLSGNYTLLFGATTTSLSLDQVALDLSETYEKLEKPQALKVRVAGDEVIVSWLGNRQLEASASLEGEWEEVPGAAGRNEIRLPRGDGMRFFRIRQGNGKE